MRKRIACVVLTLCLLLLSGCRRKYTVRELFVDGYTKLQSQESVYVCRRQYTGDNYENLKLLATYNEWRNGKEFYWESDEGKRCLSCSWGQWTVEPQWYTHWQPQMEDVQSYSDWWNDYIPEEFFVGTVKFRSEGEYTVMEREVKINEPNCTLEEQYIIDTFYIDPSGKITKITLEQVSYLLTSRAPEDVCSVRRTEYEIEYIASDVAAEKIQEQYQMVSG